MSGNSFGRLFRITTFGESHGCGIGVVVDGVPSGIEIDVDYINRELKRRRPGQSSISTPRDEKDKVEIFSGVFEGKSTGMPIAMFIANRNIKSTDYENLKDIFRPGHADFGYYMRYRMRDWRGGGRASGRETAARVAAGAIAKMVLDKWGITIYGYTRKIGDIKIKEIDYDFIEKNPVRCPDKETAPKMIALIEDVKQEGDSIGGEIELTISGVEAGVGDPVFDKLDAVLGHAILSIGGIKSFEVGAGSKVSEMKGSEYNDRFIKRKGKITTHTNRAGGILGGISTGADIIIRVAVRPPASIAIEQDTVDIDGKKRKIRIKGRHDPCIVPRVVPVVEAMAAIVLLDSILIKKAYATV